ncbi:MAG: hypothetical protein GY789_03375 [Hyphomicrobiales bacterium]|nr:hypothetical protein [Hyphomicrobiales bacterium]MCP4999464.1 hypothetical protein [Hyphomicrobiales bacterium]
MNKGLNPLFVVWKSIGLLIALHNKRIANPKLRCMAAMRMRAHCAANLGCDHWKRAVCAGSTIRFRRHPAILRWQGKFTGSPCFSGILLALNEKTVLRQNAADEQKLYLNTERF